MNERRTCQQAIFPFIFSILAERGLSHGNEKYMQIANAVVSKLTNGMDKAKLSKRLARVAWEAIGFAINQQTNEVNTHKVILTLHGVAQKFINEGFEFMPEVLEVFDKFLEIEANQDRTIDGKEITDADWLLLKKSADKISDKIYTVLETNLQFKRRIK